MHASSRSPWSRRPATGRPPRPARRRGRSSATPSSSRPQGPGATGCRTCCWSRRRSRSRGASASTGRPAGAAYSLAFEAREDVFPRVSRWCDLIASTLRVGPGAARSEQRCSASGSALGRVLHGGPDTAQVTVGADGPAGDIAVPSAGDGVGASSRCRAGTASPRTRRPTTSTSCCPPELRARAQARAVARGRVLRRPLRASSACSTPRPTAGPSTDGLYKAAEQRWDGEAAGLRRFRRALFPLPDFDPTRTQNQARPSGSSSARRC